MRLRNNLYEDKNKKATAEAAETTDGYESSWLPPRDSNPDMLIQS